MQGFTANLVNLIADNLRDRYDNGFPILKELIQNADDAKARRLTFGCHPGFLDSHHPLLQGPGLWFFNDGEFKASDAKDLRSFGIGSKAGDADVIGKFGLGMKSVFHLCEALFYVAWDGERFHCEGLTPWKREDGNLHKEWDETGDADWDRLKNLASELVGDGDNTWFLLWLPLRMKKHLRRRTGEETGAIISRFPGDDPAGDLKFLYEAKLVHDLAELLPLLRHLERVEHQAENNPFLLRLADAPRLMGDPPLQKTGGKVLSDAGSEPLAYTGRRIESPDSSFADMKAREEWPRMRYRDELGHEREARDKASPDGAVLFCSGCRKEPSSRLHWATFLPVEDGSEDLGGHHGKRGHSLILHGKFFLDAGRKKIHDQERLHEEPGEPTNENLLRRAWNQRLAQEVVLPLVLPTLEDHAGGHNLSDDECRELTGSLSKSDWFKTFRKHICRDRVWLRTLQRDGKPRWRLVEGDSRSRLRPFPRPSASVPHPWRVFPQLVACGAVPYDVDAPCLGPTDKAGKWSERELESLLSKLEGLFADETAMEYVIDFLEICAGSDLFSERVQREFLGALRNGLRAAGVEDRCRDAKKSSRLVGFLRAEKRLELTAELPESILKDLWGIDAAVLLVPKGMGTTSDRRPSPDKTDLANWLRVLDRSLDSPENEGRPILQAARDLLQTLPDRSNFLKEHRTLRIIRVREARSGTEKPASIERLDRVRNAGCLFAFAGGLREASMGLAPQLARAMPDADVCLVRTEDYREIFSEHENSAANDIQACLAAVGKHAGRLGSVEDRRVLLEKANDPGADPNARRGLRFLLHGSPEHRVDDEAKLWIDRHDQHLVWGRLWVEMHEAANWSRVDEKLADAIPRNRWNAANVAEIDARTLIEELRETGLNADAAQKLSVGERDEILSSIEDEKLWRRLPLHTTPDGSAVSADSERVYLAPRAGGREDPLACEAILVAPSAHRTVSGQQKRWLRPLDDGARVGIALGAEKPGRYWRDVMDALHRMPFPLDGKLRSLLRSTAWLPRTHAAPVKPEDVICLPESLGDDAHRIVAGSRAAIGHVLAVPADLDAAVRDHAAWSRLAKDFSSGAEGLERLGPLLKNLSDYGIGRWAEQPGRDAMELLARHDRGWRLLKTAAESFDLEIAWKHLGPALAREVQIQRLTTMLNRISEEGDQWELRKPVHDFYLRELAACGQIAREFFPRRLASADRRWREAAELCAGAHGVVRGRLLDREQENILGSLVCRGGAVESQGALDAAEALFHRRRLANQYKALMLGSVVQRLELMAVGLRPDGKKEFIDYHVAITGSAVEWKGFLADLHSRGITGKGLDMICADGSEGLMAALPAVYGGIPIQLCWTRKIHHIRNKVHKPDQKPIEQDLGKIRDASDRLEALRAAERFYHRWDGRYPKAAVKSLRDDLENLLVCFRYKTPEARKQVWSVDGVIKGAHDAVESGEAWKSLLLREYFGPWDSNLVPQPMIGAMLALLGQSVRELAKEYLHPHSFDWFVGKLSRRGDSGTADRTLDVRASVRVESGEVEVRNLLGDPIRVALDKNPDTLLAGALDWHGKGEVTIPLRRVDLSQPNRLSDLLRATAERLYVELYNQDGADFDALWRELDRSDQLEIGIARRLILDHLPFYLRLISVKCEPIQERLKICDSLRRRIAEAEAGKDRPSIESAKKEMRQALDELAELIDGNPGVQQAVTQAVKGKLEQYQYECSSIPLELFQNADDAAIELGQYHGYPSKDCEVPEAARRFVVEERDDGLGFLHWGRPINARGPVGFGGEDRGYDRDLEKMLILSATDKPGHEGVTGKFGLGFKSVLLACDHPRILSGRLGIRVVAGILPQPWEDSREAQQLLAGFRTDQPATLIDLPGVEGELRSRVLERFRRLAGVLCVFGQAVRSIAGANGASWSWKAREICPDVEVGELHLQGDWGPRTRALCVRAGGGRLPAGGSLLMAIGPQGFRALPDTVPALWVTAPTGESSTVGFAVNGGFDLDAGRARLTGNTDKNPNKARRIGRQVGDALGALLDRSHKDWGRVRAELDLAADLDALSFWESVWSGLTKGWLDRSRNGAVELARETALGALTRLCERPHAVPNGLKGSLRGFSGAGEVSYQLSGVLSRKDVGEELGAWERFANRYPARKCVSKEIGGILREADLCSLQSLGLSALVGLLERSKVEPTDAQVLGRLRLLTEEERDWESDDLRVRLNGLMFRSEAGEWTEARKLLAIRGAPDPDEPLRYELAPAECRLHADYCAERDGELPAVAFFLACRQRMAVPAETLAQWVLEAKSEAARSVALKYLATGELGERVAELVRDRGWLKTALADSRLLNDLTEEQRDRLRRRLIESGRLIELGDDPRPPPPPVDLATALEIIHEWWSNEGRERSAEYRNRLYPQSFSGSDLKRSPNVGAFDRSSWFTLLALGSFQGMGRTREEQHRGFIRMCRERGWWDVFTNRDPKQKPEEWMNIIEEYAEARPDDEKWMQWFGQFPKLYRLRRWLDDYVDLFLSIDRFEEPFSPDEILAPQSNPWAQGGGIDAPPLTRTLKIGFSLVVRELLHHGVIENPFAAPHAYAPIERVRQFFEEFGVFVSTSTGIHSHLTQRLGEDRAVFGGDYDIPLRIISSEASLRVELFSGWQQ